MRNLLSPLSRKISAIVCRSRASIAESRSTKSQPSRRASSSPTVVLPEAMNPTRNTARTPMMLHGAIPDESLAQGLRPPLPLIFYVQRYQIQRF